MTSVTDYDFSDDEVSGDEEWNKICTLALCDSIDESPSNWVFTQYPVEGRPDDFDEERWYEWTNWAELQDYVFHASVHRYGFGGNSHEGCYTLDVSDLPAEEVWMESAASKLASAESLEPFWAFSVAGEISDINIVGAEETPVAAVRSGGVDKGSIVRITGEVSSASKVVQVDTVAEFKCSNCSVSHTRKQDVVDSSPDKPTFCSACDKREEMHLIGRREPIAKQTVIVEALLEDSDGTEPEDVVVSLFGEQAGMVESGERVEITGFVHGDYHDERNQQSLEFEGQLVALGVEDAMSNVVLDLSEEDKQDIRDIVNEDGFFESLTKSFAPHLVGMDSAKKGVLATIATGGDIPRGGDSMRGDSHLLLIGDPGNGKSELLEWAADIVPQGGLTSADNSTGKGLTASVVDDTRLPTQSLKAGHLPRCHGGVACIDELDKGDSTFGELHTPLSKGRVERSVWGHIRSMPAKCRVLAAANPKDSSFGGNAALADQFGFSDSFLQRFDLVFALETKTMNEVGSEIASTMRDSILSAQDDEAVATDGSGGAESDTLSKDWLTRYINLVWQHEPKFARDALRAVEKGWNDTLPSNDDVAVRELEGLHRLARGFTRLRLSDTVTVQDAQRAVDVWRDSLETYAVVDGEVDLGLLQDGLSSEVADLREAIKDIVTEMEDEKNRGATMDDLFGELADAYGEKKVARAVSALLERGDLYEPTGEGDYRVNA